MRVVWLQTYLWAGTMRFEPTDRVSSLSMRVPGFTSSRCNIDPTLNSLLGALLELRRGA